MTDDAEALAAARAAYIAAREAVHAARLAPLPTAGPPALLARQAEDRAALVRFFAFCDALEAFHPITCARRQARPPALAAA